MRYFDEYGNEIDPGLIPKLSTCHACHRESKADEMDRAICIATRYLEMENAEFVCRYFEANGALRRAEP